MSSCISVNYGAIYPLLKRMEAQGLITPVLEEAGDAGTSRKIYGITQKGCDCWHKKMMEHPKESWVKSRARFMIKFFFFNDLETHERLRLLEHRLQVCRLRLESLDKQSLKFSLSDQYQVSIWKRAITMVRSEIQWLQESINLEHQLSHTVEATS